VTGRWRLVRADGETVPASVRRFATRARQRRLRAAAPWFVVLAVLGVVCVLAGIVGYTSLFGAARVQVIGATLVTPEEVRTAAAVPRGSPLIRLDTGAVAARVRRLAPVRSAVVTRDWPRSIVIRVVERTPVAVVPLAGGTGFTAIDQAGVAFQRLPQRPAELPVVRLTTPGPSDPTTQAALTVLASLPEQLRTPLADLAADAPARIKLELLDGRTVIWGDSTENQAKIRVALVLLERPGKVLDVSAPNLVTVR